MAWRKRSILDNLEDSFLQTYFPNGISSNDLLVKRLEIIYYKQFWTPFAQKHFLFQLFHFNLRILPCHVSKWTSLVKTSLVSSIIWFKYTTISTYYAVLSCSMETFHVSHWQNNILVLLVDKNDDKGNIYSDITKVLYFTH